jgi:Holliday junction DNA helicase RuvB
VTTVADVLVSLGLMQAPAPTVDVRAEPIGPPPDYPRSFAEFVGQEEVIRALKAEVETVRRSGRPLAHILFYGPPGVGKSALAYVLAGELALSLYESSGAEFSTQALTLEALANIAGLYDTTGRPILWLIDELDGMTRAASYTIHSLMTHGYVTWQGQRFGGVPITVMGTTNRMSSVPPALKSRFQETLDIGFYSPAELAVVADRSAKRLELFLTSEAAQWIGENAAGEPRKVNRKILRNVANLVPRFGTAGLPEVKQALALSGLRHRGLSRSQFEYLAFLEGMPGRSAGLASIAGFLGQDTKDCQYDLEPYLIRSRFVVVSRSGRQLADAGLTYLKETRSVVGG